MPIDQCKPSADSPVTRVIDRRTMLAGTAGALVGAMFGWPSVAGARAASASFARGGFDPALARSLQQALDVPLQARGNTITGAILHVEAAGRGSWAGTSGLGRLNPEVAISAADRFRAGSVLKPFVSTRILQLVESGSFTLDSKLPVLLPAAVVDRFPTARGVTLGMLLGHRSGLPEWDSPEIDATAARHPRRIWKVSEFLDIAAAQRPCSSPARATRTRTPTTRWPGSSSSTQRAAHGATR